MLQKKFSKKKDFFSTKGSCPVSPGHQSDGVALPVMVECQHDG